MDNQSGPISLSRKSDRRRELRKSLNAEVSILCEDERGRETLSHAKLVDVSVHGAKFQTFQRLPLRSSVIFCSFKHGVGGRGTVRYCNSSSKGYEIGVEFRHGTGWCEPLVGEELKRLSAAIDRSGPIATPREASKLK
jgi:hypothetical protein